MDGYALGYFRLSPTVRRRLNTCAGCGLVFAMLLMATVCCAATYRWVDEKGRVHYSDTIPPQYSGQGHTELSRQGRIIKQVDRAPTTAEERARLEAETVRKDAELAETRDRQRHDNALLATYASPREIDEARQRAVEQERALLRNYEAMRKHSRSPAETEQIDRMMLKRYEAIEKIRDRFDADKARYIELTSQR